MEQLSKEQEKALKEYRDLKIKDHDFYSKWGMRRSSPYKGKIDSNFAKLARLNLFKQARDIGEELRLKYF